MDFLRMIVLIFFVYSVIGWIIEIINCYFWYGRIINRGFLIGPYCPIYGCGAVLITLMIPFSNDIFSVFLKSLTICSVLEYITSYIMEKLFKTRWWDYSDKKFNLNGRICLVTMVLFGIGGVFIVRIVNPIIFHFINITSSFVLNIILIIILLIFIVDVIVSYNIISHLKKVSKVTRKDNTEEVTKLVRKTLREKSILDKRLINSFPNLKVMIKKYDQKIDRQKKKIKKEKERLKQLKKK